MIVQVVGKPSITYEFWLKYYYSNYIKYKLVLGVYFVLINKYYVWLDKKYAI
jgi:hypothetical protein